VVAHETIMEEKGNRYYYHRFLWMNSRFRWVKMSLPFYFLSLQVEYVSSCIQYKNGILLGVGILDQYATLFYVTSEQVNAQLKKVNPNLQADQPLFLGD
jgi:hypothetical protein